VRTVRVAWSAESGHAALVPRCAADDPLSGENALVSDLNAARDQALLRGIVARDPAALRELFERYASAATALAHRIIRDPMLAEDVVQEVFLSVWERPNAYQPDRGSVRSFVFTIVHNRAVDRVRRESAHHRHARVEVNNDGQPAIDDTVVDAVYLAERRVEVRGALAGIPAEQRQIIEMMYFDGMTQRQIAERLALPLGTVKSRTLLGMRKLQAALADPAEGRR